MSLRDLGKLDAKRKLGLERTPLVVGAFLVLWLLLSAILFAGEWVRRSGETNDPKFDPFTAIQGTQYESEPGAFVTAFNLA